MRIANDFLGTTVRAALSSNQSGLATSLEQIARARRVRVPSDDPVASVRLRALERDARLLGQYRDNIGLLGIRLEQNETRLRGMTDTLAAGRDLMLRALDGARSAADTNALAPTLGALIDRLVAAANATDVDGHFLFSGTRTDTAPVARDSRQPIGARYAYQGNTATRQVAVAQGITLPANVDAHALPDLLNRMEAALAELADPAINVSDPRARQVLSAAAAALDTAIGEGAATLGRLGNAHHTLNLLDDLHASQQLSNGEAALRVDDMDMAAAYDRLSRHTVALQATLRVYGRIMQLNPFELL